MTDQHRRGEVVAEAPLDENEVLDTAHSQAEDDVADNHATDLENAHQPTPSLPADQQLATSSEQAEQVVGAAPDTTEAESDDGAQTPDDLAALATATPVEETANHVEVDSPAETTAEALAETSGAEVAPTEAPLGEAMREQSSESSEDTAVQAAVQAD
ncbi:MAG: hypothetical protein HC876_22995, partial [Chloroflexaceae bacterium]|nr:hypothetical protein [Chloroflexaceae bacterium]